MALTPRIELRQTQTLAMTPQLRQAIKLLAMSNLELSDYVAEEVEKNPLLEMDQPPAPAAPAPAPASAGGGGDAGARVAAQLSLWDHLHAQIGELRIPPALAESAMLLADELEEDGYLRVPLEEVAARHHLGAAEAAEALRVVQSCDPVGVGARNLAECLALQLRERDRLDPAMQALLDNLPLAVGRRRAELRAICNVDAEDIDDMLAELRALDPKPGLRLAAPPVQVRIPDIYVRHRASGELSVELNTATLPRVLMDNRYLSEIRAGDAGVRAFVSECRASGNWLIRALEQRARTILKVASDIAVLQAGFFETGAAGLRPLTRKVVAERVGLHESTVSRVAAGKFLACERGVFDLRYFFSSSVQATAGGLGFSATAVQDRIRGLTETEPPARPLSDDRLVAQLRSEGIDIARRTVAKYREAMGIPSSVERRRARRDQAAGRTASAGGRAGSGG